ncbi:putative ribonuclease H-like domain-containing protein, partial [Tanacetum coccineum]
SKSSPDAGFKPSGDDEKKVTEKPRKEGGDPSKEDERDDKEKDASVNSTNNVNAASKNEVNAVGRKASIELLDEPNMPGLEDIINSDDDEDVGAEAGMNNLDAFMPISSIPTTRVHKDHPVEQIIRDLNSAPQTRRMTKNLEEHEAMQDELLQFKLQKVWTLVDLPNGKRPIGTKWVFRNKKDERGIVIKNKARLVAQGYTQEEGIDYDEEEVYVCQPPGFEDPDFPDKVYKVEKALNGLHQAPRAWYETLSTYLLENGFQRGKIDKTLFIIRDKSDILLVQVYVDDIIFGSIKKSLCTEFEKMMHKKFQMSYMGELTFFLGLQVKQKEDGIFISQDKYVTEILKKFGFTDVKTASTPMETQKLLLKDEDGEEVDVHLYRSMIGSLMYLTSSRPDIMFAVCACARYQVNPKVSHLHAVKRIFRYLKGQPKLGLWYPKDSPFDLVAYTDSDYAGASLDRKSTIGGCQFLGSRLISWQCKKQTVVANSTTEAEYNAAGTDTRPPMLVESDYESWKIRIHRYIRGKPNGKLIWKSIQNGPTPHPMITDPPPTDSAAITLILKAYDPHAKKTLKKQEAVLQDIVVIHWPIFHQPTTTQTSSNTRTHATVHDVTLFTEPTQSKAPGDVFGCEAEAFLADVEMPCTIMINLRATNYKQTCFKPIHEECYDSDLGMNGPMLAVAFNVSICHPTRWQTNRDATGKHLDSRCLRTEIDDNTIPYHQYLLDTEPKNVQLRFLLNNTGTFLRPFQKTTSKLLMNIFKETKENPEQILIELGGGDYSRCLKVEHRVCKRRYDELSKRKLTHVLRNTEKLRPLTAEITAGKVPSADKTIVDSFFEVSELPKPPGQTIMGIILRSDHRNAEEEMFYHQMDVKSAFLYGKIEKEVYVCQPPGFEDPDFPNRVYKVEKALYGLHQAPRAWYETLSTYLLENRFQVNPKVSHLHAVKRICRYLKGQSKLGLWYPKDSPFDLVPYTDSDSAGASLDRKSTTRGCQFLGCRLISWQCKKQTMVANSTLEAEYVAASSCYGQVLWIQNQLLDYGDKFMHTKIYIDNESTICIVKNPFFHSKTKHIEIRHHFIGDSNEKKLIQMIKIHTDKNVAYLLTKAFDLMLLGINLLLLEKVNAARHNLLLLVGNPQQDLKNKGVIDSRFSRHMTGNRSYLTDYEEVDGGFVAFRGNSKGGKITGKDALTNSMNYKPVVAGNQSNGNAGTKACDNAGKTRLEIVPRKDYILLPLWTQDPPFSSSSKDSPNAGFKPSREEEKKDAEDPGNESGNPTKGKYSDDEDVGAEVDMNNLYVFMPVSLISTTRIQKDHLVDQIIRDLNSTPQTRRMIKNLKDHEEPKKVIQALKDPSWIEAMQVELLHSITKGLDPGGFTKWQKGHRIEAIRLFLAYASFKDFVGVLDGCQCAFLDHVFLDKQVGDMTTHDEIFVTPSHTKKVFGNMKRFRKGFSRAITPLFPTMMVQDQEEMGEADEAANEENVLTHSNDLLINGEDRLKLVELMTLCTNLQNRVLDLEHTKTTQALEIESLKRRMNKLEKKQRGVKKFVEEALVAEVNEVSSAATITTKEITLAQALAELRSAKPKVVVQEPVQSTTTTTPSTILKAKRITFRDPGESTTRTTLTSIPSNIKDKGKAKMIEPKKPLKMKEQIRLNEELAFKLQAKEEEQARLAREKAEKVEEANISWDNV